LRASWAEQDRRKKSKYLPQRERRNGRGEVENQFTRGNTKRQQGEVLFGSDEPGAMVNRLALQKGEQVIRGRGKNPGSADWNGKKKKTTTSEKGPKRKN